MHGENELKKKTHYRDDKKNLEVKQNSPTFARDKNIFTLININITQCKLVNTLASL
jgi:hypothetical protein